MDRRDKKRLELIAEETSVGPENSLHANEEGKWDASSTDNTVEDMASERFATSKHAIAGTHTHTSAHPRACARVGAHTHTHTHTVLLMKNLATKKASSRSGEPKKSNKVC